MSTCTPYIPVLQQQKPWEKGQSLTRFPTVRREVQVDSPIRLTPG